MPERCLGIMRSDGSDGAGPGELGCDKDCALGSPFRIRRMFRSVASGEHHSHNVRGVRSGQVWRTASPWTFTEENQRFT